MILASLLLGVPAFRPYRHPVTTWVPPYAVAVSRARLASDFGGAGMGDGLTHLALQFWVPTPEGGIAKAGFGEVTDANVVALRDWAHAHGVRAMLCVFNGEKTWDWPLARKAFGDHREAFVRGLLAEVRRQGLDGIDVDLEGPGEFEADKPAFVAFMRSLSAGLRARKLQLTVDTFSAMRWNTPNQSWWPGLFPLVDALTTMGYEDGGRNAPEWRGYAAQKKMAGAYAPKLQLGLPGDKDRWRGDEALDQIEWIAKDGTMGVGVWDAQLNGKAWRTSAVWRALGKIRG